MATKASAAFGRYGTRPLDLHGDWYTKVSYYARLVGMDLIAHCKDPGDLRLPVSGDWRETLCGKLAVLGADRRNARGAMDMLVKAGFLHPDGSSVRLSLEPELLHSGSTSVPVEVHSGSTPGPLRFQSGSSPDPLPSQPREIISPEPSSREGGRLTREGGERAREGDFRKPLPEQPPDLPPADPPLAETIVLEHAREYGKRRAGERPPEDRRAAVKLADWCERNAALRATSPKELALLAVAGLYASTKAAEKRWKLSWAAYDPAEYLPPPPGVTPLDEAYKPTSPTHKVWEPPDYEREQREAEERAERYRLEHPEYAEGIAAFEATLPKPRVVVSIAQAKPAVKSYRPKTPEEIAARRLELEEQVRALKAANAAE